MSDAHIHSAARALCTEFAGSGVSLEYQRNRERETLSLDAGEVGAVLASEAA